MKVCIVDSSLLIQADFYRLIDRLHSFLHSRGIQTIAPPRVFEETVSEPSSIRHFKASAERIESLFHDNVIAIEKPVYSDSTVSRVVDRVRDCIARKAKKYAHLIERADLQIVILAVSRARKGDYVELIFRDKPLEECLLPVLGAHGINSIHVTDSNEIIKVFLKAK